MSDDACHVENLERPRKDCECFRMYRLLRLCFDEPPSQTSARALIREKEPDRSGPND